MATVSAAAKTIGVFDSGFGGLTVLRELLPLVPGAHYIYLGDTARLPYGAKSQTTIARYAVESARFLESRGADHLVIACNTASALAMSEIKDAVNIPVTGVIEPAVEAAQQQHRGRAGACAGYLGDGAIARVSDSLRGTGSEGERKGLPAAGATGRGRMDRPSGDPRRTPHLSSGGSRSQLSGSHPSWLYALPADRSGDSGDAA